MIKRNKLNSPSHTGVIKKNETALSYWVVSLLYSSYLVGWACSGWPDAAVSFHFERLYLEYTSQLVLTWFLFLWITFCFFPPHLEKNPLACAVDWSALPVFQSAWVRWPLQSVWVWTGTCWVWTGSPAPGAADWWRPCGASGTSPTDRTEGPLGEEEQSCHSVASCKWIGYIYSCFMTTSYLILAYTWILVEFLCLTQNVWIFLFW